MLDRQGSTSPLSRRRALAGLSFLTIAATLAARVPAASATEEADAAEDDAFVMIDGWVLRKDDLDR